MKTIAILGASSQRTKFGNKAVRAYQFAGWTVYPINPAGGEVEGLPALRALAELPAPPARVSVYLPPPVSLALLPEIAAARPGEVWFNPGAADEAVLARARELGLNAIDACSIVDIGLSPSQFP
jgi:uncharacterized protein